MEEFEFEEAVEEVEASNPEYGSPEWEAFVMHQFLPTELYEGDYPTLNGMRRVALLLFGDIVKSGPTQVISNLPACSYCVYEIEFENGRTFGASADAHPENISGAYGIYPTAIAESRAEARAYRKALLLTTVSAEEVKGNEKSFNSVLTSGEFNEDEPMSDQVRSIIESRCKKLKINLNKFLESEGVDFAKANKSDGMKLSKKINEFQNNGVPKEIQ